MKASFDGTFPDIPLPNPESGLSRIHVDATCLPASGVASGPAYAGSYAALPIALVVTFSHFNSFNSASYFFRDSQFRFWIYQ